MVDIEKVVKWLKHCRNNAKCNDCESCEYGGYSMVVCENIIDDALELLKEYKNKKERNPVIVCPHCGKRVK